MIRRLRAMAWRVAGLFGASRRDRELAEEFESHIRMHAEDNERAGLSPEEARRQALVAFGGVESAKEQYRDRRGLPFVDAALQDIRYALRGFRRSPGFTAAVLAVLALGIGANSAIFTVVNAVLLKPLPYGEPERLVMVWHVPPADSFPGMKEFAVSPANYFDWERQQHVFERMTVGQGRRFTLTGRGQPQQLLASAVSSGFFDTFRVRPQHGRPFHREEDQPGQNQVVVLSHKLWQARFGGDVGIVGAKILLDATPYTVVGVMGPEVAFPSWAELWTPLGWTDEQRAVRANHNCWVAARLAGGVDLRTAQAEMSAISRRLELQYPEDDKGWGAVVKPLQEDLVGDIRPALLVLLGAVGFVLLIACANVANLVLVRTLARRQELAVRLALGAGPRRVVRQVLTETTLLAAAGGVLGLIVANGGVRLITAYFGDRLPHADSIAPDGRVLLFTLVLSAVTGLLAGLAPALRLARANVLDGIKQGGRADTERGGVRLRSALVVVEVGLSLVLLVGAGLMVRSLWQLSRVDPGLDPANVLTASVSLAEPRYPTREQQLRFFEAALDRIQALPGVESAGLVTNLPLTDGGNNWPIAVVGRPQVPMAQQPQVQGNVITPGYLQALRIRTVRGRALTEDDREGQPLAALVSESTARWLWPGENAIGGRFVVGFLPDKVWHVVGIVKDVKERGLSEEGTRSMYFPLAQTPEPYGNLVVRTRTSPAATIGPALVAAVQGVDPDQPVMDLMPMEEVVKRSTSDSRFTMLLLAAFAALALVLAAVGIYSVLAYAVRRRLREIGIRIALGAERRGVVRMIIADALRPTLLGIALGLAGAVAVRGAMASLIFGISPGDPATFGAVATLLLLVAVSASAIPAYRATKIDPISTLRDE